MPLSCTVNGDLALTYTESQAVWKISYECASDVPAAVLSHDIVYQNLTMQAVRSDLLFFNGFE